MTQLINEAKRMQKLAGVINESQLNEEKIPFFHLKQVLTPFGTDKPIANQMADLKVGLNVLPKKAYRDESDVKAALGKITKIEGDNVTIEKVNGEEANYKKSDLFHLIDGGYKFESLDIDAVVNEALAKVRKKEQTNELFGFGAPSAKVGDKIYISYDKEIMQNDHKNIVLEYIGGGKCKIVDYNIQKFDVDMGAKSNYEGSIFLHKGMTINVGDEQAVGNPIKINNASGPKIKQIKLNDKEVKKVKFK